MKKIILMLLIAAGGLTLAGCPFQKDSTEYRGRASLKHSAVSPKGVRIYSLREIDPAIPFSIDAGLDKAFAIASAAPNNYEGFSTHSSYTVYLWPRSSKCLNPAIYQFWDRTTVYDQTEFDKDPRPGKTGLCFAGIQRFQGSASQPTNPNIRPGMLIVDDRATAETITWYEAEHNILIQCDYQRWIATMNLHDHPILGNGSAAVSPSMANTGTLAVTIAAPADLAISDPAGETLIEIRKGERLEGLLTK